MDKWEITAHQTNECNRQIKVTGYRRGAGGAGTRYDIIGPSEEVPDVGTGPSFDFYMKFQDGPVDAGVNGLTNEVLLAILADRLEGFQRGRFANPKNAQALEHIQRAMQVLNERTQERIGRGVEGTHEV